VAAIADWKGWTKTVVSVITWGAAIFTTVISGGSGAYFWGVIAASIETATDIILEQQGNWPNSD